MRRPPPPHPRGAPRTPGSGRRRGTPNRRTVAMRELMMSLCNDVDYQYRLRSDFRRRRVHPSIEALAWAHVIGKPTERVQLSADVMMNEKLAEERELFSRLSVEELEEIAAESEALIAKARAMAQRQHVPTARAPEAGAPVEDVERGGMAPTKYMGIDVARAGVGERTLFGTALMRAQPRCGSPSRPRLPLASTS